MPSASFIWMCAIVLFCIMLLFYARAGAMLKSAFFTAFTGVGALGLLWIAGQFISVPVSVTPLSIALSVILGVPGVLAMLIIHLI